MPGRYADGGTLYLHIAPGGSKSWVQRITVRGRRRDLGLGAWPVVSLAEARTRALASRVLVERGGDPLASKRKAVPTFREASQRTYEANRPRWRSAKVAAVWMQRAERHAFPKLGDLRVDAIGREEILRVLTPIWTAKPETARKVRAIIRSTLAWAEAHGHVERNMAGDAIDGALPAQPAVQAHFRTVPHADVAAAEERRRRRSRAAHPRNVIQLRLLVQQLVPDEPAGAGHRRQAPGGRRTVEQHPVDDLAMLHAVGHFRHR